MKFFTFIIFTFCFSSSQAQNKKIVGVISDTTTAVKIAYASITNISAKKTVISNENGFFTLDVSRNDIVSIAFVNTYTDTIIIDEEKLTKDTIFIFLQPITKQLQQVTVNTTINRYQYDSTIRRKQFLQNVGGNKISTVSQSNSGAGIALNIDRFSKRERNKRKAYHLFDVLEQEHYINYRFSAQIVTKYTGLKGKSLLDFMQNNRPTYQWLRNNLSEEDIKYYINHQLKQQNKSPNLL